jgi:hypothetical protein
VFVLAGNHEFYRSEYGATRQALRDMCASLTVESSGQTEFVLLDQNGEYTKIHIF